MKSNAKIAIATTAFAVGGWLGTALAPTAAASPNQDVTFLNLLTTNGLTYGSADVAISQGHAVCGAIDAGNTITTVWTAVERALALPKDDALTVVAAAVVAYCPWDEPGNQRLHLSPNTTI